MVNLTSGILKGSLWVFAGRVARRFLGFGIGIVMARLLIPEDFGLIVTMSVFTGIAGYFAGGGMGSALIRATSLKPTDFAVVFTAQLAICTLIFIGFYLVAPLFAEWMGDQRYELLMQVSALTFLLRPFNNIPYSKINREMRFRALSALKLLSFAIGGSVGIFLAWNGFGPWSLIYSGIISTLITIPIAWRLANWYPHIHFDKNAMKSFAVEGIKFSANDIVDYLRYQVPNLLISKQLGASATGIFNRAQSLSMMPREIISGSIYQPLFRGLSKIKDDRDLSKATLLRAITIIPFYTMPAYIFMWWLAEPFIIFVYGGKWADVVGPLQVLAVSGLLLIGNPSGAIVAAQGALGRELKINLQALALLIIACLIGSQYGVIGIATAVAAVRLWVNLRIYWLAASCVNATTVDMLRALRPAYVLNAFLVLSLVICDQLIPSTVKAMNPFVYLLSLGFVGTSTYIFVALFLPITAVQQEVTRWKGWIRGKKLTELN